MKLSWAAGDSILHLSFDLSRQVDFYHTLGLNFVTSHPLVDGNVAYNICSGGVSGIKHYVMRMENPGNG